MITFLRSLFSWRTVRDTGVHFYQENAITGARRVLRRDGGYQPVDRAWLRTGDWSRPGPPPNEGSGGRRIAVHG